MSSYCFLNYKWYFLLDVERYLNFNRFNSSLMNLYFLILNAISVSFNRNFLDDFVRNLSFNFDFDWFFNLNLNLYYLFWLNYFILFLFYNYSFFDLYFYWDFNSLNFNLRYNNFNNLKLSYSLYNYFLNNFRYFNYSVNYSWYSYYFLHNLLNLDNSWYLHYFFNNSVDELGLYFHDLLLNNYRYRSIDLYWLDYLLFGRYYLNFLNLNLLNFFRNVRYFDFSHYWNLFSDIQGYYFFP
jgi:hypothetical protein